MWVLSRCNRAAIAAYSPPHSYRHGLRAKPDIRCGNFCLNGRAGQSGWRGTGHADTLSCPLPNSGGMPGHSMNQLTELLGRKQAGGTVARATLVAGAYTETD